MGSEGGPEHPELRPLWRGKMGLSKQEQLDLFAGNLATDEDSTDADDLQDVELSIGRAVQASISHTHANAASSQLHASDLSTSRADSSNHDCACSGQDQSEGSSASTMRAQEMSGDDTGAESSWSDSDFSSDSGSGSEASDSEGSDTDPETSSPIKVH